MDVLAFIVWSCLLAQGYHFVGYPLLLALLARVAPKPHVRKPAHRKVSLIISCFDEAPVIAEKLENSLALSYPDLEIIVNSEGSRDATPQIVARYADRGVIGMHGVERRGKSKAMNAAVQRASAQILVFSDANVFYEPGAIDAIAANFADPQVGVVTGRKEVRPSAKDGSNAAAAEGVYWRYENAIKELESSIHSTVAVHGEMLAMRREVFQPIPDGTVNDDAYLAMSALARGYRVVFEDKARCWEAPSKSLSDDSLRRRRMSAGRFQLVAQLDLLRRIPAICLFMFLSHKVLRLFLPLLALLGFVANVWVVLLPDAGGTMWLTLAAQVAVLGLAALGAFGGAACRKFLPAKVSAYLVAGYLSGLLGVVRALRGRQSVLWEKAAR
jgi:cellulose synthase/poly-beta-1,6-N-acetylglucosamine synthase-like glycosyltransferase